MRITGCFLGLFRVTTGFLKSVFVFELSHFINCIPISFSILSDRSPDKSMDLKTLMNEEQSVTSSNEKLLLIIKISFLSFLRLIRIILFLFSSFLTNISPFLHDSTTSDNKMFFPHFQIGLSTASKGQLMILCHIEV